MTEVEKLKNKRKKELRNNTIYIIVLAIMLIAIIVIVSRDLLNRYEPDPSLYVEYDLSKDTLPDPKQKIIPQEKREKETWKIRGTQMVVTKIATYDITGKVEAIKDYGTNLFANMLSLKGGNPYDYISPIDLTLSWGDVAKEKNSGHIFCDQYELNTYRAVMIRMDEHMYNKYGKKAKTQVSNNHIVTLDKNFRKILSKIKLEDIVRMKGYLILVEDENNGHWGPSSLVRDDNGCEIILLEDIVIMPRKRNNT